MRLATCLAFAALLAACNADGTERHYVSNRLAQVPSEDPAVTAVVDWSATAVTPSSAEGADTRYENESWVLKVLGPGSKERIVRELAPLAYHGLRAYRSGGRYFVLSDDPVNYPQGYAFLEDATAASPRPIDLTQARDVCAGPNLTLSPDGRTLALVAECDDGFEVTLIDAPAGTRRGHVSRILRPASNLIVGVLFGWTNANQLLIRWGNDDRFRIDPLTQTTTTDSFADSCVANDDYGLPRCD